jgi:hypothetical protein
MRRISLVFLAVLASLAMVASTALAQGTPEFKLGFKALADQIPQVAGVPLENEHWGANGDSLQQTTTGLMAWRKADNWTAFTNGSRTWVNGPFGVMERANEERFAWEADAASAARPAPPQAPTVAPLPTAAPPASSGSGYTNVDGNWVPSPGSNPAGASAQCRDGTYSYSQHRQGTCSGHGGVARWLP